MSNYGVFPFLCFFFSIAVFCSDKPPGECNDLLTNQRASFVELLQTNREPIFHEWSGLYQIDNLPKEQSSLPLLTPKVSDLFERLLGFLQGNERFKHHDQNFYESVLEYPMVAIISEFQLLHRAIRHILHQDNVPDSEKEIVEEWFEAEMVELSSAYLRKQTNDRDRIQTEIDMRKRFIATVAHDLRTPIQAIELISEMLNLQVESEREKKLIRRITNNAKRLDRMVVDLLDVGRMQVGGRIPQRIEQIESLRDLLSNCLDELKEGFAGTINLNAGTGISGYWSADGIARIVENLVGNALKFGDAQKPITVSVTPLNDEVVIGVHNFGPVIPDAKLEKATEIYTQVPENRSREGRKGWGIGLTVVKGIAEAHGGLLKAETAGSDGMLFSVVLPRDARPYQRY